MLAVAGHLNIQSDLIPRIASGFCAGISRTGSTCGAVSGGIMAISLALGRTSPTDDNDPCYSSVQAFLQDFISKFGTLSCLELTGCHLGTPEGYAAFWAKDEKKHCLEYVTESTRSVIEILDSL